MLRKVNVCRLQVRCFSQTQIQNKGLRKLVKRASATKDSEQIKGLAKEVSMKKRQEQRELYGFQNERNPQAALTKQHAASVLARLTGEDVDMNNLGPLSNDDVKYFSIAPRAVIYTLLGISENQLLDSLVVDATVQRFLKRGQFEKALMTAKLAEDKGAVAMNNIMKNYLSRNKVNDAIDLYSWRKKWSVPVTNHTLTVLFDGCANVRKGNKAGLTTNQVKKLKGILLSLKPSYHVEPNMIHINSAFSALMNCSDQTIAMELFDSWFSKEDSFFKDFRPNSRTYTILLKNLYLSEQSNNTSYIAEILMARAMELPEQKKDLELYEAFVMVYLREKNPVLVKRAFYLAPKFFRLESITLDLPSSTSESQFLEIDELKDKFFPSVGLIDALVKKCSQLGDSKTALKLCREFFEGYPELVDRPFINRYLQALSESNEKEPGLQAINLYSSITENPKKYSKYAIPNHFTRLRVFLAIYKESLKNLNHQGRLAVAKNGEKIFNMADDFLDSIDAREVTAYEMYGYTKALRKVALKPEERAKVLMRINTAKFRFDNQKATKFQYDTDYDNYIEKVMKYNKALKEKHEIKPYLKKKDRLDKLDEEERFRVYKGLSPKDKDILEKMKPKEERASTQI